MKIIIQNKNELLDIVQKAMGHSVTEVEYVGEAIAAVKLPAVPIDISQLYYDGYKIRAIKEYRNRFNTSIKDAKDMTEADAGNAFRNRFNTSLKD